MSQKMIIFIGNVTIKVISENKLKRLSQFPIILSLNLIISQFIEWAKMIISVQSTSFIYYFIPEFQPAFHPHELQHNIPIEPHPNSPNSDIADFTYNIDLPTPAIYHMPAPPPYTPAQVPEDDEMPDLIYISSDDEDI